MREKRREEGEAAGRRRTTKAFESALAGVWGDTRVAHNSGAANDRRGAAGLARRLIVRCFACRGLAVICGHGL